MSSLELRQPRPSLTFGLPTRRWHLCGVSCPPVLPLCFLRFLLPALSLSIADPDRNRAPEAAATFEKIRFAYNRLVGNAQYGTIELKGHDWIGRVLSMHSEPTSEPAGAAGRVALLA